MEIKRILLWVFFLCSITLLFNNWMQFNGYNSIFSIFFSNIPTTHKAIYKHNHLTLTTHNVKHNIPFSKKIHFITDLYEGNIDTLGGTLSHLSLINENTSVKQNSHVRLFNQTLEHTYLARTGLTGGNFPNHLTIFKSISHSYILQPNQKTLVICCESENINGLKLIKIYTFTRGSYVIKVTQQIKNFSTQIVKPILYIELVRDNLPAEAPRFSNTYIGPVIYTSQNHFQKISFGDIEKKTAYYMNYIDNGWIAMVQHYFASAWIPSQGTIRNIYVKKIYHSLYRIGYIFYLNNIQPGMSTKFEAKLFAGPQKERMLENIAPGLELIKDYGWVTIIAKPLFWLLEKINSYLGNWGWSIITLTLLIKAIFFPLAFTSYKSILRMKELTPRLQALRDHYKNEPIKLNTEIMNLYKSQKVNPLGGCLPIFIQIPVFISLYWVLLSSVEIRVAPWILWIHDLSQKDPYFILPIMMTISTLIQAKLNPTSPDPIQAKLMLLMPLLFSIIFFFFPAGLVLYYLVNNILSILQQWYITRIMIYKK